MDTEERLRKAEERLDRLEALIGKLTAIAGQWPAGRRLLRMVGAGR